MECKLWYVISFLFTGIISFCFLALAIGTEYWYIIEDKRSNHTDNNHLHSGLWGCVFCSAYLNEHNCMVVFAVQNMHNVIAILLPLSLVLLVFGGICGLVSSLARSRALLMGLLTLSGVSLYITYSQQALEMTERRMGPEQMALVHTSFGWSMGMAWLSFILEVITGFLLLISARMAQLIQYQETVAPI
uniref:Transmembrane protein 235b n=1 Tax=Astyanax mexicanus TaxID=7994 RepID=A0A8B9KGK8_ASTMX